MVFFIRQTTNECGSHEEKWHQQGETHHFNAKWLITIFWSPLGFPVIDALPAGEKFTGRDFCDNIAPQIAEQRSSDARQNRSRKFVVHMDNATPQRAKSTKSCFKTLRLREADHPPYSSDLALSYFYLFNKLKGQMAGSEFESPENLLATIRRLINAISREEFESVFQEWERRLEECIRIGGDYVS
jgi:hypothetical protein